jgi:hypothetical protein
MTSSIIRVTLLAFGLLLLPIPARTPARAEDTITREQADTLIKEIRELRQAAIGCGRRGRPIGPRTRRCACR